MIRYIIIISILFSFITAFGRPLDSKIASIDVPAINEINTKIIEGTDLNEKDKELIRYYLNHQNQVVISLAAWSTELLGERGHIFLPDLRKVRPTESSLSQAHIILAINAIEMGNKPSSEKIDSMLNLLNEENKYLTLEVIKRMSFSKPHKRKTQRMLKDYLSQQEGNYMHSHAVLFSNKWDISRGRSPGDQFVPRPTCGDNYSALLRFIDNSGGLEKSSYFK
jgi:hypothetical protein